MFENEVYKEIEKICNVVTKHDQLSSDLTNEVALVVLGLRGIKDRWEEDKEEILRIAYGIAYKQWFIKGSLFNRENKGNYFNIETNKWQSWDTTSIDFYDRSTQGKQPTLEDLIEELNEIEQKWVCEWYSRNCSIKKLSEDADISRPSIHKRLNEIFEKIRKG
jgi:hypothetical protein